MDSREGKPKLVYFMAPLHDYFLHDVQWAVDNVINGLAQFFELVVINKDCDYAEICDQHRPALTIFEGVVEAKSPSHCRLNIRNASTFPDIPKIGFLKLDPYSPVRSVFLSEMQRLGIETFFAWDPPMAEYTPELAGRIFYLPAWVDTTLFREYGQSKTIPLLFLGRCDGPSLQHSWRTRVKELASQRYPSLVVPYAQFIKDAPFTVHGEQYARLINASLIVPTAGSMSKTLVMKHLEIPAAKACLVTERTPIVEAFGFSDMVNCVFADEHDILDKLDYLFSNRDVLDRITTSGYELVRSHHTANHRPQLLQWLQLHKSLKPGQRIVQRGLFKDLEVVNDGPDAKNCDIISRCEDRILLQQGDQKLIDGKYRDAEALYSHCFNYVSWMAEPRLRLAICKLYQGNPGEALSWLRNLLNVSLGTYESPYPDPVEWAYLLVTLLCYGQNEDASVFSQYFLDLGHPELARARWAVRVLSNNLEDAKRIEADIEPSVAPRKSIHQLPPMSFETYLNSVCTMLRCCRQRRAARLLSTALKLRGSSRCATHRDDKPVAASQRGVDGNPSKQEDIPYLLERLERLERARFSGRLKEHVKVVAAERIAPALARKINGFARKNPRLKAKMKDFILGHLKVQDW